MDWAHDLILVGAALGAGVLNAVAGGGTFLTFPALLFAGVNPIHANATSTVSVWPGGVASALAYRRQLAGQGRSLLGMALASLLGGGAGAVLLLKTPVATFTRIIPLLLLAAALLFTFSPRLLELLRGRRAQGDPGRSLPSWLTLLLQFGVSIYGGYFGAGVGILMLALYALLRFESIHQMNALKALLNVLMNAVAIVIFVAAGAIEWGKALLMAAASIAGGYLGAALAQRLDPRSVRAFIIATAWGMTAWFAWKTWRP